MVAVRRLTVGRVMVGFPRKILIPCAVMQGSDDSDDFEGHIAVRVPLYKYPASANKGVLRLMME